MQLAADLFQSMCGHLPDPFFPLLLCSDDSQCESNTISPLAQWQLFEPTWSEGKSHD